MMRNVLMKTTVTALFLYHQNATCYVKIVKKSTYPSIRTFLDALASLKTMLDIQSVSDVFKISRLQSITEYYRVLQSVTECYRVLQFVTVCYRVLQSVAGV